MVECLLPGVGEPVSVIPGTGEPVWHFGFHAARDVTEALVAGRERMYLSYFYQHFAYNPAAITAEDVDEYVRCYSAPGALRAGFEQYRAMPQTAAAFQALTAKTLDVPVLALGGERCMGETPLAHAKLVARHAEGGSVARCGHWVPEEQPAELAARLLAHFAAG